ncbi:1788_t:CDS:2, partial [Dentiscutata erythropus]
MSAPKNFNFNVNTLKLTPEKLAEWCKRRASNTLPLSQAFRKESSSSQLSSPDQNHHNNDSQLSSNDSSSQQSTNYCTLDPHEMDVGALFAILTNNLVHYLHTFHVFALVLQHRLETIEASIEQIQESQLYTNQDLDYLEKSLEYFEDELAVAR